jgi:hypothetical protein
MSQSPNRDRTHSARNFGDVCVALCTTISRRLFAQCRRRRPPSTPSPFFGIMVSRTSRTPYLQSVYKWCGTENCKLSNELSGFQVVHNICETAHEYGEVTSIKAYADLKGNMADKHRTELHCAGVSLIDCPHNGYKEVVDNTLIGAVQWAVIGLMTKHLIFEVDMMAYAIDHAAPSTIILISGDRDFAYALSVLRLRRYRIIVMVPKMSAHPSLISLASVCIDWHMEIIGKGKSALGINSLPDGESSIFVEHIFEMADDTPI